MAEQSRIPDQSSDMFSENSPRQPQQAGVTPRAPHAAWEAEAPRIARLAREPAPERPITDWASI